MSETPDKNDGIEEITDVTQSTVGDLFKRLRKMSARSKVSLILDYCSAKAMSEAGEDGKPLTDNTRMEFLKEAGRDGRALIKDFSGDGDDEDRGPFPG